MRSKPPLSSPLFSIILLTIGIAGCSGTSQQINNVSSTGGTPASTTSQTLYVSTRSGIAGFAIQSADGSLSPLSGSPFAPSLHVSGLIPSPSGRVILVNDCCGTPGAANIWLLRVDSQGGLQVGSAPVFQSSLQNLPSLAFSSSGKTVYLAEYLGPALVTAHAFDENAGTLAATPSSQMQFPIVCNDPTLCSQATGIIADSVTQGNEYLWVEYGTCVFHEDCDSPIEPVPVSNNGAMLASSTAGATNTGGSSVTGTSAFAGGLVMVQEMTCCSLVSIGSYVFQNGQLASANGCPIATDACATAFSVAVHPNQKLVIIGTTDNKLLTAARDATGNLSMPVATNVTLPMEPEKLLFDQSGQHLYALGETNLIFGFSVNANSGALTPITGSPWTVNNYAAETAIIVPLVRP